MKSAQQKLEEAVREAQRRGLGVRRTARLLKLSNSTVLRIRRGVPGTGARVANEALKHFRQGRATMLPVARRSRPTYPAQLKQLHPIIWRVIKEKCRAWGFEICATWWSTTPDELKAHVLSRSKVDATEFLANVRRLQIPCFHIDGVVVTPQCNTLTVRGHQTPFVKEIE